MIWFILLGPLVIGLLVIRYTYMAEKRKLDKEKRDAARQMKEYMDMLKINKDDN